MNLYLTLKSETKLYNMNKNIVANINVVHALIQYIDDNNLVLIAWKEYNLKQKKEIIQSCSDRLDLLKDNERLPAAKILTYIALGNFTMLAK